LGISSLSDKLGWSFPLNQPPLCRNIFAESELDSEEKPDKMIQAA
jgi:hypothetical protein